MQGRFGDKDAFNELRRDGGVQRDAALQDLLGQISVGEDDERTRIALGEVLHRLDDPGNAFFRVHAQTRRGRLALGGQPRRPVRLPDAALDLHAEEQQEKHRQQQKDDDKVHVGVLVLGKERDDTHDDDDAEICDDESFGAVLVEDLEDKVDEQKDQDAFQDEDPLEVCEKRSDPLPGIRRPDGKQIENHTALPFFWI